MSIFEISGHGYHIRLSNEGGVVVDGEWKGVPIFRPYPDAQAGKIDPLKSGSFPLVPFGNRVEENVFAFEGERYELAANTDWDRHYLHGDGWLNEWDVKSQTENALKMQFNFVSDIYCYEAEQLFEIDQNGFSINLTLTNIGAQPMPFGMGHHPFFPLTPKTTLEAPATGFWTEKHDYLPDQLVDIPSDQNYTKPKTIPIGWLNNGFEGWNGNAQIKWPESGHCLEIKAPEFDRYFLFRSDTNFDPSYKDDFFCFEPMSHSANGHNLVRSGLEILNPSQSMSRAVSYQILEIS